MELKNQVITMSFLKRAKALLCAGALLLALAAPLGALAQEQATGLDVSLKAGVDPYAMEESPSRFTKALAAALSKLDLQLHAVLQSGQADVSGTLNMGGLPAIRFRLTGWEERLSLTTTLFGEKPTVITPPNYIPFLLKTYFYTELPLQYIGVFTDPYSYIHGIRPVMEDFQAFVGGEGSRTLAKEEAVRAAETFAHSVLENMAFTNWRAGLLTQSGLDELVSGFLYDLPGWMAEAAGDTGLVVEVAEDGETWTLGETTVYTMKKEGEAAAWRLHLPQWEGYVLEGEGSFGPGQAAVTLKLLEEEAVYASLSLKGEGLPDGRNQGEAKISLTLGGEALGAESTHLFGLSWNQQARAGKTVLEGRVEWLHPQTQKPMAWVSVQASWGNTKETFVLRTGADIQGIDLFCMNDETIKIFFADAKWALIKSAIPFVLELPPGLINGVVDTAEESGMLATIMEEIGK